MHTSGLRGYGTPPIHHSGDRVSGRHRQDTVSSSHSQPLDHRRALPSLTNDYEGQQCGSFDQQSQSSYASQPSHNGRPHHYFDVNNEQYDSYNGDQYSNDLDYHQQLPPVNHSLEDYDPSAQPYEDQYEGVDPHRHLHHAYSTPAPSEFDHQSNAILRRSMTEANTDYYDHTYENGWDSNNPFGPDHPESLKLLEHGNYDFDQNLDANHMPNGFNQNQITEFGGGPVGEDHFEEDFDQEAPPPPPPTHRYTSLNPQPHSSPGYNRADERWDSHQTYDEPNQWPTVRKGIYGGRGHLASKSEVCLPSFREPFDEPQVKDLEYHQQRQSYNSEFNPAPYNQNFGFPRQSSSPQNFFNHDPFSNSQSNSHRSSLVLYSNENPQTPIDFDTGSGSRHDIRRDEYDLGSSQSSHYKSSPQAYVPNGISPRSSPHSINGTATHLGQLTPSRPHPLSKHETLSSSPHHQPPSPYEGIPLIKPLAISPNKLKLNTSTPSDRYSNSQKQSPVKRKSLSPMAFEQKTSFSSPYSPDCFDVLNPAVSSQSGTPLGPDFTQNARKSTNMNKDGPIVDFHGNVVDPSDRLPETSWAPEPTRRNSKEPSNAKSPGWARDSANSAQENPRKIRLRIGAPEKLAESREIDRQQSFGTGSSPANRASMYTSSPLNSSPVEPSPSTRNKLVKKSRPKSMAPMSSWSQPIRDVPTPPAINGGSNNYNHAGPLVPGKIPLDSPRSSTNYGVSFTNNITDDRSLEDPFALSNGIQGMHLGNGTNSVPRRIGGRRLLGFGG
jgi:hypothetical protein